MEIDLLRHGRQVRLREVGVAGQARLYATSARLGAVGEARWVERAYLAAAGVKVEGDGVADPDEASSAPRALEALGLRHVGAREVGEGAMRALYTFRSALGLGVAEPR